MQVHRYRDHRCRCGWQNFHPWCSCTCLGEWWVCDSNRPGGCCHITNPLTMSTTTHEGSTEREKTHLCWCFNPTNSTEGQFCLSVELLIIFDAMRGGKPHCVDLFLIASATHLEGLGRHEEGGEGLLCPLSGKDTRLSSDVHHCSLHAIHCLKKRCKKWYPNVLIWQLPFPLLCTPNTKTCQRGCVFVFSASPTHSDARQDLNPHPCWCVFALSVLQIPPMDDKHETTPILVCFCVWHLSYTLPMHYKGVYPPSYIFSVQWRGQPICWILLYIIKYLLHIV